MAEYYKFVTDCDFRNIEKLTEEKGTEEISSDTATIVFFASFGALSVMGSLIFMYNNNN